MRSRGRFRSDRGRLDAGIKKSVGWYESKGRAKAFVLKRLRNADMNHSQSEQSDGRLEAASTEDAQSARDLLPIVYDELKRLAAQRLAKEAPGQTLQAKALVHDAYLRLVGDTPERPWKGRAHFLAAAAEAMRRILVESARKRQSLKRGADRARIDLDGAEPAAPPTDGDLLALDEALEKLAKKDPAKAQLVQLRVFAGLTLPEAAENLGLSDSTADRYWSYANAWLRVEIEGADALGRAEDA